MAPEPTSPEMDLAFRSRTNVSSKRSDYISWDEYFMSVALLASQRSKDPVTQVGAAIVTDKVIVGVGYNGMPRGCDDDDMPWGKTAEDPLENKYLYVCHAEMNAILNKNSESVRGSTIYCTLFPCCSCAKYIIQAGINRVVYLKDKPNNKEMIAAKLMFEKSGVQYSQFAPTKRKLVLDFGKLSIDISTSPSTTSSGLSSEPMLRSGVVVSCRAFSTSRSQMKEADLIAKAFVNKIREYGQKNAGGSLINSSPEAAKQLSEQLNRLAQKFQLANADVVGKLPLQFKEAEVESSVDALLEGKDLAALTSSVKQSHEAYKKERAAKLQAEKERQLALNESQNGTQPAKSA